MLRQVTLSDEVLLEYRYYVMGFVPADVVRLKENVWFMKLDPESVALVDKFLKGFRYMLLGNMCKLDYLH